MRACIDRLRDGFIPEMRALRGPRWSKYDSRGSVLPLDTEPMTPAEQAVMGAGS